MSDWGKRINFSDSKSGLNPAGVCTWVCPQICDEISRSWCKCPNNDYESRGGGYNAEYLEVIQIYRTPDLA